ncbi:MAG: Ig-like domain-containing protein, partial [Acidimicrobiales bacterium]
MAVLSGSLLIAGCDGGGPTPPQPLEIESVTPAAGATGVETGATVAVVFNEAIDPATLTSQTFKVSRGGGALATTVSYDAATRTGRAAAPLLPNTTYQVEVTTGVRTPAHASLSAARQWSFTTRPWQAATVDATGNVGLFTSLAVDATGRLHV